MGMFHYVLFKFKPGYTAEDMEKLYNDAYTQLSLKVPGIIKTSFRKNCVTRDSNMDVLIAVQLKKREDLQTYLTHPLHLEFVKATHDHVAQRVSFDWEESEEKTQ